MLQPKRTKYRKQFKGRNTGLANRGSTVAFGEFGLKATERARMTAREIEAARRAMARAVKRGGQIWVRVFPDVPVSKKPLEVRMGSGKGNVEFWVAKVQPGKVLFEMEGVPEDAGPRGVPPCRRQAFGVDDLRQAAGALMKTSRSSGQERPGPDHRAGQPAPRAVRAAPAARHRPEPSSLTSSARCARTSRASRPCSGSSAARRE